MHIGRIRAYLGDPECRLYRLESETTNNIISEYVVITGKRLEI